MCVFVSLQLVKLIEDTANKMDSSPVELETQKLAFGREDENKYPLLAGMAIVNIRLRAAIFQVCVSMPGSAAARLRPPRVLYCSGIHLPMHGDTKVPSSSVVSIPVLHVCMLIKTTVHKPPHPNARKAHVRESTLHPLLPFATTPLSCHPTQLLPSC